MNVFDASALLAYLQGESGSELVKAQLETGGICGIANWAEVVQKVHAANADWELARSLHLSFELQVTPVTEADAAWAARMWRRGGGLSLAGQLCLAPASRLGAASRAAAVWTADAQ